MNPKFPILDFSIALFIGALVGLEREKKRTDELGEGIGGLRTFILISLAGAVSAYLAAELSSVWIFVGGALSVTSAVMTGYFLHARERPESHGLTTEIAALVVFLLGGTTLFGYQALAVALAIATSALLAYKQPLHGLVRKVGQEDIYAFLKLLIATFIVLPVLPNRAVDPWGALNPYRMWLLVILISGLSLVGYVASRWFGAERGIPLTGLFGGLASSTAVSLEFARRSRDERAKSGLADALAAGVLLSWGMMFARILVQTAVVNPALIRPLLGPMAAMGLVAFAIGTALYAFGSRLRERAASADVPLRNPFSITAAVRFALFFAAVLLLVKWVQLRYSGRGLYLVAALAGLTDVDAITLSMAEQAKQSGDPGMATAAITIAALTNTATKCGIVLALGAGALRKRTLLAAAALLAVGLLALALG